MPPRPTSRVCSTAPSEARKSSSCATGGPVAKLVPVTVSTKLRKLGTPLGTLKGRVRMSKDFDAPLSGETLDSFEGKV